MAEFEALQGLHEDVVALRGELRALTTSVAGCQAVSLYRQDLARRRPGYLSAVAAWAALALTVFTALFR